jgi:hypothetical protein
MRNSTFAVLTAALGLVVTPAAGKAVGSTRSCASAITPASDRAPVVQLAILLDTSNSMDGLIDQARAQLWDVVNQFSHARRGGRPVELQVALYEYGNTRLDASSGWVRRVLPFTSDLDRVSEALFALKTQGGDEFCGTVIQAALDQLQWGKGQGDLRVIFIAGNEPFTQGPVSFRPAVRRAAERGIVVNTIHCGSKQVGEATGWSEGARLASGAYSTIDQGQEMVHIDAPQDGELARLGLELNRTYVPYGAEGRAGSERQAVQDSNAANWKGSAVNRAVTKANSHYQNDSWDLVDAYTKKQLDPAKVRREELPEALRALPTESLQQALADKAKDRKRIQDRINQLDGERQQYVAHARKLKALPDNTLDAVMSAALRSQAACQGIELE